MTDQTVKECIDIMKKFRMPDVLDTKYHNPLEAIRLSFESSDDSYIFCDNVILWSIGGDFRNDIYGKCKAYFSHSFKIKLLRSGILKDNDISPSHTPYLSYKISLSE